MDSLEAHDGGTFAGSVVHHHSHRGGDRLWGRHKTVGGQFAGFVKRGEVRGASHDSHAAIRIAIFSGICRHISAASIRG